MLRSCYDYVDIMSILLLFCDITVIFLLYYDYIYIHFYYFYYFLLLIWISIWTTRSLIWVSCFYLQDSDTPKKEGDVSLDIVSFQSFKICILSMILEGVALRPREKRES